MFVSYNGKDSYPAPSPSFPNSPLLLLPSPCSSCCLQVFQQEMLRCGVFIPDRDAQWELEDGAFQELYSRHSTCDTASCLCPLGRRHQEQDTDWELVGRCSPFFSCSFAPPQGAV